MDEGTAMVVAMHDFCLARPSTFSLRPTFACNVECQVMQPQTALTLNNSEVIAI